MAVNNEPKVEPFPVIRLCKIPKDDRPRWLIEGLWSRQGCGVVAGHPKLGKTWIALEMALAIASGRPCLGRFAVRDRGPVLVYCIEDGKHGVRDRMEGLCEARGLDFEKLGIGWIDAEELTLDRPEDQLRLHATVEKNRAKAIVLDPLVRLHLGDESSSQDISRLLRFLRSLQRRHGTAVILVHHTRKAAAAEHGQALRGSGDLHAWGDSNLYIHKINGHWRLSAEHRAQPPTDDLNFRLADEPPRIILDDHSLADRITGALADGALNRRALRDRLGIRAETLAQALDQLIQEKRLRVADGLVHLA